MSKQIVLLASLLGSIASSGLAGDLAPPAGPIGSTMKDLQTVEPRTPIFQSDIPLTISNEGSYYLAENLFPAALGDPYIIRVFVSHVSIDLRGFVIDGATEVTTADDGILIEENIIAVEVRDGTIKDCLDAGIDGLTGNFNIEACRFANLRLTKNLGAGLEAGVGSIVESCVAEDNGSVGINAGQGSVISNCAAHDNVLAGMFLFENGTIVNSTAYRNQDDGFALGNGATIIHCTARNNGGDGIDPTGSATVIGCTASDNTGNGIGSSSTATIRNCNAIGNGMAGIRVSNNSLVVGNNCAFNTEGIRVSSDESRIDGNNVARNDTGILVTSSGNFIVRNTARDNTVLDYDIAVGNSFGAIVNAGTNGVVVNGSAPSVLGTTDPWANFEY